MGFIGLLFLLRRVIPSYDSLPEGLDKLEGAISVVERSKSDLLRLGLTTFQTDYSNTLLFILFDFLNLAEREHYFLCKAQNGREEADVVVSQI